MKNYSIFIFPLLTTLIFNNFLLSQPNFTLLNESIITGAELYGGGWGDYDNDGYLDLFAGKTNLFHNLGDGTFDQVYDHGIEEEGNGLWIDYDNDGDLDISFRNYAGSVSVYSNNGDGSFTNISIDTSSNTAYGVAWADYDNDGFLDVFIGRNQDNESVIFRNIGDGIFELVQSILGNDPACRGFWGDYNNDGYIDLFMTLYDSENFFYHNNGDGSMIKIEGLNITEDWWSIGASWVDYNNDGFLDLFVFNLVENSLYTNNGDGSFTSIINDPIVNIYSSSRSCAWGDYDNDGDQDLFVGNGYPQYNNNLLYTNNGDGTFTNETNCIVTDVCSASGGKSWGDYDNDGDLDLAAFSNKEEAGMSHFFLNNGNGNNWINIKCIGTISNRSAIGSKVRLKAIIFGEPTWQMVQISAPSGRLGQNSLNVEIGLGNATIVDTILVQWPSGNTSLLANISINQFLEIEELEEGIKELNIVNFSIQPNPVRKQLTIEYKLKKRAQIIVTIYNQKGVLVISQLNEIKQAGNNKSTINMNNVSPGIYFCTLKTHEGMQTRKIVKL